MRIVIIGGVAGGMTVARRLRRQNKNVEIVLIDKSYHLAPSTCSMPYALEEEFNTESLYLNNIEKFQERYNIQVKLMNEVIDLDEKNKQIKVMETGSGAIYNMNYDKLVISTGTDAIKLKELNYLNDNIFIFKNITNLERLKKKLSSENFKDITIIGAGVLGLELAESLAELGYNINLIDREKNILNQYDSSIVNILNEKIKDRINILINENLTSAKLVGDKIELNLSSKKLLTELIIVTVGNRPNVSFIERSSIEKSKCGHIIVDEYFKTNIKDIYALGDVILTKEFTSQKDMVFGMAGVVQRQARFVADNILTEYTKKSNLEKYPGAIKTEIFRSFEYTLGRVGLNEREIKKYYTINNKEVNFEQDILKIYIEERNNVAHFEDSSAIYLLAFFDNTNKKLLGIQALGKNGVDKRLDVAATAIKAGMNAYDLVNLDLAYSPPYNLPKDILNRLGSLALKGDNL